MCFPVEKRVQNMARHDRRSMFHQTIDANLIKHSFPLDLRPSEPDYATCNGLILISDFNIFGVWAIWNPLTKEFRILPRLKFKDRILRGFGLGYVYEADDYKVVAIYGDGFGWETFIYSYTTTYVCLESLDGCLFCSLDHITRRLFEGWVMKDNGVEKSWIKLFSLQHFITPAPGSLLMIVAYLKSKHQVVLQHDLGFLWFDIGNNYVKNLSIHGLSDIAFSQIYSGSLVRLKNRDTSTAIGVGAVSAGRTRKRKRNREIKMIDTRLKFCVREARLKFCVRDAGERCCSDNHFCGEDLCRRWKEE